MAATLQAPPSGASNSVSTSSTSKTPQLKRIVYSKYRELLGSYNDKANAIIETLPSYMVHEDRGFNFVDTSKLEDTAAISPTASASSNNNGSDYGQRGGGGYEAPACVQNAMMTKDKKPFTYTPGGIDLSQIKSERMAKRLARNAQAEGATGASQQNRPVQPQSPNAGSGSGGAAAAMGAAALGMPFQVLPPPPPPPPAQNAGKTTTNGNSAPPPPPPQSTLAPPSGANGRAVSPGSPSVARKSPTPQRFEPPPLGFRPEIKIPANPMATLRKVPPPVEKNTFWKDEYVKERSKSPLPETATVPAPAASPPAANVAGAGVGTGTGTGTGGTFNTFDSVDAYKKPATPPQTQQQSQQQPGGDYNSCNNSSSNYPTTYTPTIVQQQITPTTPRQEFRSVAAPQSPAVNIYTRQSDSPQQFQQSQSQPPQQQQQRATESPFHFAQQQQQQQQQQQHQPQIPQQQRTPIAISPLAQQQSQTSPTGVTVQQPQAQTVPWRTQRNQQQPQQQQQQSHPQPIYNNVQAQQQQQRSRDVFSPGPESIKTATTQNYSTQPQYQGPKPTNVGSLYIAPLSATPAAEPQAPNIVRQQLQQQQQGRDSPMRQLPQLQSQPQPNSQQQQQQQLRWMSSQPTTKEQAPWARPDENSNVLPSSLRNTASPQQYQQQQPTQQSATAAVASAQPLYQSQLEQTNNNGFPSTHNFGSNAPQNSGGTGLRLQIGNNVSNNNNVTSQNAPRERIIPITLEQTPTYPAAQPNFGAPAGHIIRSANQFVDQGYNNYPTSPSSATGAQQQQWREPSIQRVLSPTQQLNAPRIIHQQQQLNNGLTNNTGGTSNTRIIPISLEGGRGGPISQSPVLLQNEKYNLYVHECPLEAEIRYRKNRLSDPRSPPIQSKSFRILQKITDTIDDGPSNNDAQKSNNNNNNSNNHNSTTNNNNNNSINHFNEEPQLQRPQFARQMSAQQARNSPTIEQMRRMQIAQDQQQQQHTPSTTSSTLWQQQQQQPGNSAASQSNRYPQQQQQQRPLYEMPQNYVPPSEQQVPEPKKYTGSAIPSRSFKILQAMTTPENADHKIHAELDSDLENVELNDNNNNNHNNYNTNNQNNVTSTSITSTNPTYSSNSSLNSDSSATNTHSTRAQSVPPHYPYAYGYPYPWYPPPPPSPSQTLNGDVAPHSQLPPNIVNWPYPYPYPPPHMPPPPTLNNQNVDSTNPYLHYPYYYPYYPPPPPPPYGQPSTNNSGSESSDLPNTASPSSYPHFIPPYAYPYPVAPSYSQSSTSSRASSVLPDIIITPSSDETGPSKVILQHHIKVEKREPPPRRAHSVEIEEVSSKPKQHVRNTAVIDMLSERLSNIGKISSGNTQTNLSKEIKKNYAGEQSKQFDARSPSDNASPVQISAVSTGSEADESDSDSSSDSDSETEKATPKEGRRVPLQAIKSVTNVRQAYTGFGKILQAAEEAESDEEDVDVTTADGESDVFDEEEEDGEVIEELELDEFIENHDIENEEEYEDDLSVIYEEESEVERSSDYAKTVIKRDGSSVSDATIGDKQLDDVIELEQQAKPDSPKSPNNGEDDEESTSVTVRLPLKFSFSRDENVATVEIGNSQIEERRNSMTLENKRNSFSIAQVDSDSDSDDGHDDGKDDCELSVTISLTPSSQSNSIESKMQQPYKTSNAYPVEEIPTPPEETLSESKEDISATFSLNMRNKFATETKTNNFTNNIATLSHEEDKDATEQPVKDPEELDFFATLRATKLQAQKMMEQSKNYWGTSTEKKLENLTVKSQPKEEIKKALTSVETKLKSKHDMASTEKMLDSAKNSFWETFEAANKEIESHDKSENVDYWIKIEEPKESNTDWIQRKKTVTHTQMVRENMEEIEYWTTTLHSHVAAMPMAQTAVVHVQVAAEEVEDSNKLVKTTEEEKEKPENFWASIEKTKEKNFSNSEEEAKDNFWQKNEMAELPTENSEDYQTAVVLEEEEIDFWRTTDTYENNPVDFDPTKYPEEPREVDTDEEIDFWAEIEANRRSDDDEVTFHKSASFWARQERQNSVDETPYKPVEQKPFPAKLPDAEASVDIDIWAALEAARGEEPVLVDPAVEEEKNLAAEFDSFEQEEEIKDDAMSDIASVHEPATVHVWAPQEVVQSPTLQSNTEFNNEENVEEEEHDFWADIEMEREKKQESEEAEQKRNNYRKAMAFFNTSIDENKEQNTEKFKPNKGSPICSSVIEEEEAQAKNDWNNDTESATLTMPTIDIGPPGEFEIVGATDEDDYTTPEVEKSHNLKVPNNEDAYSSTSSSSSSESTSTPTTFERKLPEIYIEPKLEVKRLSNGLPDLEVNKFNEERKVSVRDRISVFEAGPETIKPKTLNTHSLSVESCERKGTFSRNSSSQRSESEMEEDDSGVTDMNKPLSETDTESESFPELRKMTSYQRAATHSRLFKLLQDENDLPESIDATQNDEFQFKPSRRKIVHNVSITRKQNPQALADAETMSQRRERLSLPLRKNISIDADNPSTPNSPASPIMGQPQNTNSRGAVTDKLVNELVQSLLLKSDSTHLRQLPMSKLQAAAKRALEEEMDSLENTSVETTPAPTPNGNKHDKSYTEYYNTWSDASGSEEIIPSKSFRALQDGPRRSSPWTVRCPRVLSSKMINRDVALARVTESPEIATATVTRTSKSPECFRHDSRERSVSSWRKV